MADEHIGEKVYPVAGWAIGPLTEHNAITFRFEYLDMDTMQRSKSPFIGIPREQLQELVAALNKAVAKLDAAQSGPEGHTRQ